MYVVVPPLDVEFRKQCASAQAIYSLGNEGGDVAVSLSPFVDRAVVLNRSK